MSTADDLLPYPDSIPPSVYRDLGAAILDPRRVISDRARYSHIGWHGQGVLQLYTLGDGRPTFGAMADPAEVPTPMAANLSPSDLAASLENLADSPPVFGASGEAVGAVPAWLPILMQAISVILELLKKR
jgi:hypothetical protein